MFLSVQGNDDLNVEDLETSIVPWSDQHLLRFGQSLVTHFHGKAGRIRMVYPQRLLDPIGLQDDLGEFLVDLVGAPLGDQNN